MTYRPPIQIETSFPDIAWPAIPANGPGSVLAMLFQLEQSQWWDPQRLRDHQFQQLRHLLVHAWNTIPFHRQRFESAGFDPRHDDIAQAWRRIPILTRSEAQAAGPVLTSTAVPRHHFGTGTLQTSGSTGQAITLQRTGLASFFWRVLNLREHLWHRRDFSGDFCAIRSTGHGLGPEGKSHPTWGPSFDGIFRTGKGHLFSSSLDVELQRQWLVQHDPMYLLSLPTNLRELALCLARRGGALPKLRQVCVMGESLPEDLRELVRQAWGVSVADVYSCEEVGCIAAQCPDHEHLHVQAEAVMVEVLDDRGEPCAPGQIGRVVLTGLHNFATPFIRYAIDDFAQVGPPCPCGRGLPVLTRVMGRQRNMLIRPDGARVWPSFPPKVWAHLAPIRQMQLVQRSATRIDARVVMDRPFTAEELARFAAVLHDRFGYPFEIVPVYVERLERGPTDKMEDFLCLIGRSG